MIDELDKKIMELLKADAKMPLRKVGEAVHLTAQAVSSRIIRLQNTGVILKYTIETAPIEPVEKITAYITIFMKTTRHKSLADFIQKSAAIKEAHKISGDGCYLLKTESTSMASVNALLDELNAYGTYRLNLSTAQIK
jgi:Transcriptional regulators